MERLVRFAAPRQVELVPYEEGAPAAGEVRVRTLLSGISAGTELTAYRGTNPYIHRHWDAERRLFGDGEPTHPYPLDAWGYEQVGEVVAVADDVQGLAPGDCVWGIWGHRSSAVICAERVNVLPPTLPPVCGVFARIGAIALNAVLDAEMHVGETVAVFGQGVPGLLATQLAGLSGADVVAVDPLPARRALARELGAAAAIGAGGAGAVVKELTEGRGADVSIEVSGSAAALAEAIRATAYGGRVVVAGFAQGEAGGLRLGEEFHHNRIELVSSQISSVAARLSRRWSVERLERTVLDLRVRERLRLEQLVSHVLPVEDAAEAFRLLDERPEEAVQVVLSFGNTDRANARSSATATGGAGDVSSTSQPS